MEPSYRYLEDLASLAEMPARGIHSQTVLDDEGVEVVLFAMAAGERLNAHTAARPAIVHVLSGGGDLVVAGNAYPLRPGSWLRMRAGTGHALTATSPMVFALYLLPRTA